jgi:hypothetical protein
MRKLLIAMVITMALSVTAVLPAAAHQGHRSCAAAGALAASLGKTGQLGTTVSGVATSGPGTVAATVKTIHTGTCAAAR